MSTGMGHFAANTEDWEMMMNEEKVEQLIALESATVAHMAVCIFERT